MTDYYADWDGKLKYRQERIRMDEFAFCENGNCTVIIYKTRVLESFEGKNRVAQTNCPSCGRFGRLKDEPK